MLQADEARKAIVELPVRMPKRLRGYLMLELFADRERMKESVKWLHATHGDPIIGKDKRQIRRELGFGRDEDAGVDLDIDPRVIQKGDVDPKEFEMDVTVADVPRRGMLPAYLDGLSGIEISATSQTVKGKTVVMRWELNGTHTGPLLGVAPTQREVSLIGITMIKFDEERKPEGGRRIRATDEWTYWDMNALMEQIGATQ